MRGQALGVGRKRREKKRAGVDFFNSRRDCCGEGVHSPPLAYWTLVDREDGAEHVRGQSPKCYYDYWRKGTLAYLRP